MKKITRSALLPFASKTVYDIVNDVSSYPDFLPWCGGAKVLSSSDKEMVASITIAKAGLQQTFTTRNHLTPHTKIEMELVEGPFSHMAGEWTFTELDEDACKITFVIEFQIRNRLLNLAIGPIFEQIATTMVHSFSERARALYGKPS